MNEKNFLELEKILNLKFKNKSLLVRALTHSSYVSENGFGSVFSNERLEFLGDSVLQIVVSDYLYNKFEDYNEGNLSKIRARLVSRDTCFLFAKKLNLGKFLLLGIGEEKTGGRKRVSNLSNSFEAILGAIYIDRGFKKVFDFLLSFLEQSKIEECLSYDYKTELQEKIQKKYRKIPYYKLITESGITDRMFVVNVMLEDKVIGNGIGKNKKHAEQCAAKDALKKELFFL